MAGINREGLFRKDPRDFDGLWKGIHQEGICDHPKEVFDGAITKGLYFPNPEPGIFPSRMFRCGA